MSARTAARHADWLGLVDPLGPFLTLPILRRALPEGLERTKPVLRAELRERVEGLGRELGARHELTGWVLRVLLGFGEQVRDGQSVPDAFVFVEQVHHVVLRPDFAVLDREEPSRARLLVTVHPAGTNLGAHTAGERWAASPIDRMITLCRGGGCLLGVVTDGDRFTLVWAPPSGPVGRATWVASVFAEGSERNLLDSFVTVLGARRFFAASPENRLEALLAESGNAQADVSGKLGLQVRRATELLVAAFSRADRERGGALLAGVEPHTVYEAAATVMMRLVFLLYAEERRLLPLGDALYDASYAASTLREELRETADRLGDDALDHRATAWPRLLATFRAVYGGLTHDQLRIPSYGGRLFDPDRYPFLEGRRPGDSWRHIPSEPIFVDDRSVLGILTALQILEARQGGVTEARRLSFLALDVEQIGHVYEGLLDHSAVAITKPTLGLVGKSLGAEPEVALDEIEAHARRGREALVDWLPERTGKSKSYIERMLEEEVDDDRKRLMLVSCDNDPELARRVEPYAGLVREDLRGVPIVLPRGSLYVSETSHRRDTGTEYTPRELADEVVKHALEPLVYSPGPAEEANPELWKLRSSEEIQSLRICDPAVGSGAFLVAACRFLGDRVVEAWNAESHPLVEQVGTRIASEGEIGDLVLEARRRVAERCLFGVDRDPMAVEMAKLSLWLTTMSRDRPFSFLDHALQAGDSLLGITSLEQVLRFHIDPKHPRQLALAGDATRLVDQAVQIRRRLEATPVIDLNHAEEKSRLLAEAEDAVRAVKIVADLLIGAALVATLPGEGSMEDKLGEVEPVVAAAFTAASEEERRERLAALADKADAWLNQGRPENAPIRHCLHWPLAFPEAFEDRGAFDAIVGNPPFLGGQRLTARIGRDVREFAVQHLANGQRGSADLVAYFFLRAAQIAQGFGLLATNTISQGDTREVGLDQLSAAGWTIHRATKSEAWRGSATLEISKVWAKRGGWKGARVLGSGLVSAITTNLDPGSRVAGPPYRLTENAGRAFQGSNVLGLGFTMSPKEAAALVAKDPRNGDVLFPYLNGDDLNSHPTHVAGRWVINFFDWSIQRASLYAECFAIVESRVKPERAHNTDKRRREIWWQFTRPTMDLYRAIGNSPRVLVVAQTSKLQRPAFVDTRHVFDQKLVVFVDHSDFAFGVLSSDIHWHWIIKRGSSRRRDPVYTPSDVFETFPQPAVREIVPAAGKSLENCRRTLMIANNEGLTTTYNRVHNASDDSPGIRELRDLHQKLDLAVRDAYGWQDLELNHGFHETSQGVRFTIGPAARTEVLDRLLELNHARYAQEVAVGLHRPKKAGRRAARPRTKGRGGQAALFGDKPEKS